MALPCSSISGNIHLLSDGTKEFDRSSGTSQSIEFRSNSSASFMGSPIFYAFTVVEKTNSPSAAVREPIVFAFDAEFRSGHFNRCACPLFSLCTGDANLYRYVGNKPTMSTDPSGLDEHLAGLPLHGSTGYWFSPDGKRHGPEYRGNGWFSPFAKAYDSTKHKSPWFMADPADTSKDLRVRYQNGSPNFNRWVKHTTVNGKYQPISVLITLDNRQNLTDGGRRKADYAAADKEFQRISGIDDWKRTPEYTWHHQTIDPKTGSGQMILVDTKVHSVADHWGPYSLYRDILEAAQAGEKKTLQNLVERAKKLKLLKLTKVAGGVSLVLSAGSAYAGFQKDGTAGAVEAIGKDVSMQEEIGWVIMLPNNMVYRDWLKIDPDKPFDVLVDECLDKRLNGAGVSPVK